MKLNPLEVELVRGQQCESRHQVVATLFARNPQGCESFGDDGLLVFPRSSLKPIQSLPLILSKAADNFQLGEQELAIACASHRGEEFQIKIIQNWMNKVGINETDLECGTHAPANTESLYSLLKNQKLPSPIHNNCSGKHTGMLTTAIYLQEPTKNYVTLNHPVQIRIIKSIEKLCQIALTSNYLGIDGCSIPAPSIPLKNLAQGFCEFIDPIHLSPNEAEACQRLYSACTNYPLLTAGNGHYCSEMMKETQGKVLLKGGAEGVMAGAIPQLKMGFALKALDGNSRATEFCTSILLNKLGLLSSSSHYLKPKVTNWNHIETGHLQLANSSALP